MRLRAQLVTTIETIRTSFWFVPLLMVLLSTLLAVVLSFIDKVYPLNGLSWFEFAYQVDPETIKSLLNTIAGSMITVTSIAFSITIVTLTLASSQFGPRLIRNFMADTGTKIVLGTFISNFSYCIVLVYVMSLEAYSGKILGTAIIWCLISTFASVCVLIFFIHHVASAIQADSVIDDVSRDLVESVDRLLPNDASVKSMLDIKSIDVEAFSHKAELNAGKPGYIQYVDLNAIESIAQKYDVIVQVHVNPGDFVAGGTLLVKIFALRSFDENITSSIKSLFKIGSKRTPVQDPEYAIHQLVEIAVRALSPGINDPYTAMTCVDKLSSTMCVLTSREFPGGTRLDEHGILRVYYKARTFTDLGKASFDQIRQYAVDSIAVTIRLIESLNRIAQLVQNDEQCRFVTDQIEMLEQTQKKQEIGESDWQDIQSRINDARELLAKRFH